MGPHGAHLGSGFGFRPNLLATYHISHPGNYSSIASAQVSFLLVPLLPTYIGRMYVS